jgi:hypothetical protein
LGRKEHQRADGDKAGIIFSSPALNVVDLLGKTKLLTLYPRPFRAYLLYNQSFVTRFQLAMPKARKWKDSEMRME